ncbi:cytochrome P450 4c21-like isoform X2 [Adelges cooleyi]|uniref:cytochrome P450 4c21-like isoform X2 n=1 Tax=Adelges cooleyi TaxID=133065 RepID=UPI002180589A|nr:cytochrome P450 4c21-like isoform X2 [Adelges cooleyi]
MEKEQVLEELLTMFSSGDPYRQPTYEDLQKMQYLERAIKETLRLHTVTPVFARKVEKETMIGGYLIPEGTAVDKLFDRLPSHSVLVIINDTSLKKMAFEPHKKIRSLVMQELKKIKHSRVSCMVKDLSQINSIVILIAVILFLVVLYFKIVNRRKTTLANRIPGPDGLFFLGLLPDLLLRGPKKLWINLLEISRKYENTLFKGWILNHLCIFSKNPEVVQAVLTNPNLFKKPKEYNVLNESIMGDGISSSKIFHEWKMNRKLVASGFKFSMLKSFVPIFYEEAKFLSQVLYEKQEISTNECEISWAIGMATLEMIGRTALGVKLNAQKNAKHVWEYRMTHPWFMNKSLFQLSAFKRKQDISQRGQDTTPMTNACSTFMLAHHQDVQNKVLEELLTIFSTGDPDRQPTYEDLQKMQYSERVIKETLRHFPLFPLFGRDVEKETMIGDFLIPAGSTFVIFPTLLHLNADIYPEPEKFNPDNFLPEACESRHPYSFVPFSAGYMNCPGIKYAMLQMQIVISTLVRSYRFHPSDKCFKPENLRVMYSTTLKFVDRCYVKTDART